MRNFTIVLGHALTASFLPLMASAQTQIAPQTARQASPLAAETQLIPLGHGMFLEKTPPKFETVAKEVPDYIKNPEPQWVVIPAVFETKTETVVIQDAFSDLIVKPAVFTADGALVKPAETSIVEYPAVTKEVLHRTIKTPSRVEKRVVPYLYTPQTRRVRVKNFQYILRDESGKELARYDTPEAAMRFIDGL